MVYFFYMPLLNRVTGNIETINVHSWSGRRSSSRGWRSTVRSLPAHISPWTIESQASQRILLWDYACTVRLTFHRGLLKAKPHNEFFCGIFHCGLLKASERILVWDIPPWTIEILLWDIPPWTIESLRTNSFVGYSTVDY
jgi:hypothetical protein